MASSGFQPGQQNAPAFPSTGAPSTGPDLEELARFTVLRGNTLRGTTAQRNAYTHPVAGLLWSNTTTGTIDMYGSSGWVTILRPPLPFAMAAGSLSVADTGTVTVTFPPGRFTVVPIVNAFKVSGGQVGVVHVSSVTETGFNVQVWSIGGVRIGATVHWQAMQMTASSAAG